MEKGTWDENAIRLGVGIEIDEDQAARNKTTRAFEVEASLTPRLRLLAFAIGAFLLLLHNRAILGRPGWAEFFTYWGVSIAYCLGSWAILHRYYGRTGRLDLALVFLILDVPLFVFGLQLSGLEKSWLFPILLIRAGDQSHTNFKRALAFAHYVPLVYLAWLVVQPRAMPWPQELVKTAALYASAIYIASSTRVADSLRAQTRNAIRVSRELILKLREYASELAAERKKASDANQAKSEFLSTVSHDLRTPLNAILLYSELVESDARETGQEDLEKDMQKIQGAGKHLLQLLNTLLDLAKIEAGMMTLFREDLSVAVLVEEVRAMAGPLAGKNRNRLAIEVDPRLKALSGDATRLQQIFLNLLGNAAKFTEDGLITLRLGLVGEGSQRLVIQVTDTGIGMTPDQCEKLFQEYVQAEEGTTRKYGGTGLGLALCRQLARLMGGEIQVESTPGKGSTFTVEIPYLPPVRPDSGPAGGSGSNHRGTILVIEDDADFREGLVRIFQREGCETLDAATGQEGLELARMVHPDLITLDVNLPDISGWEVLATLRAEQAFAAVPIILMTLSDDRSQGFALGASDFLPKPIEVRKCVEMLQRHLTRGLPRNILLVEDDERLREALTRTFEGEGWQVRGAGDGREALKALETGWTPHLVLLDLQLPEMDGYQFMEALRMTPQWRDLPVIVATGMELDPAQRARLASKGVRDVVSKGTLPREELLRLVGEMALNRAVGTSREIPNY